MFAFRLPSIVLGLVAAALPAQIPSHATTLNPWRILEGLRIVQDGDTALAFDGTDWYSRSTDGGRTWSPTWQPLGISKVSDIARSGDLVLAVGDIPGYGPLVARSTDGGVSWSPPVHMMPFGTQQLTLPRVHVAGANVVVAWVDTQARVAHSVDGGLTWTLTAFGLGAHLQSAGLNDFALLAEGSQIRVFWLGSSTLNPYLLQQVSQDGGATWLPAPQVLWHLSAQFLICGTGNDLYYVDYGPNIQVLKRSHDGGTTWTSGAVPGMVQPSWVAVHGQTVVVSGTDTAWWPTLCGINVSQDGGATWLPSPWQVTTNFGLYPRVFAAENGLYGLFRLGDPTQSLLIRSLDNGVSWQVLQEGVHEFSPGPRRNLHVMLTPFAWLPSEYQYHAFVGEGYTPLAGGSSGTGGHVPSLQLTGPPSLGATTTFAIENAVGGTLGVLGVAAAAPQAVPVFGGTLWLQGALVPVSFATSGAPGVGGAGSFGLPVAVPNTPALAGASLTAQALLLDAGAAGGLALSDGVEVWLR